MESFTPFQFNGLMNYWTGPQNTHYAECQTEGARHLLCRLCPLLPGPKKGFPANPSKKFCKILKKSVNFKMKCFTVFNVFEDNPPKNAKILFSPILNLVLKILRFLWYFEPKNFAAAFRPLLAKIGGRTAVRFFKLPVLSFFAEFSAGWQQWLCRIQILLPLLERLPTNCGLMLCP